MIIITTQIMNTIHRNASNCAREIWLMSNGNKRVNKKVHCFVGDHLAPDLSSAPHAFLFQQDSGPGVLRCENSDFFSFSLLKFSKV